MAHQGNSVENDKKITSNPNEDKNRLSFPSVETGKEIPTNLPSLKNHQDQFSLESNKRSNPFLEEDIMKLEAEIYFGTNTNSGNSGITLDLDRNIGISAESEVPNETLGQQVEIVTQKDVLEVRKVVEQLKTKGDVNIPRLITDLLKSLPNNIENQSLPQTEFLSSSSTNVTKMSVENPPKKSKTIEDSNKSLLGNNRTVDDVDKARGITRQGDFPDTIRQSDVTNTIRQSDVTNTNLKDLACHSQHVAYLCQVKRWSFNQQLVGRMGQSHNPTFTLEATILDLKSGEKVESGFGTAGTKKDAKHLACFAILNKLKERGMI